MVHNLIAQHLSDMKGVDEETFKHLFPKGSGATIASD